MSINLHVSISAQDIINDLNTQVETLRNENSSQRLKINYILGCLERIPKVEREKAGLIEESEFQKRIQNAQKGKNSPSQRPKVG